MLKVYPRSSRLDRRGALPPRVSAGPLWSRRLCRDPRDPFPAWPEPSGQDIGRPGQGHRGRAHQAADRMEGPDQRTEGARRAASPSPVCRPTSPTRPIRLGPRRGGRRQGARLDGADLQRPGHRQRPARRDAAGAGLAPGRHHHAGRRQCAAKADQGRGRAPHPGHRHPRHGVPRPESGARPVPEHRRRTRPRSAEPRPPT